MKNKYAVMGSRPGDGWIGEAENHFEAFLKFYMLDSGSVPRLRKSMRKEWNAIAVKEVSGIFDSYEFGDYHIAKLNKN